MLLTEYDEQAHIESEREIALREGEEIGMELGKELSQVAMIRKKYMKNILPQEAAEMLELSVEYVEQVMRILASDSNITDGDIVGMLHG